MKRPDRTHCACPLCKAPERLPSLREFLEFAGAVAVIAALLTPIYLGGF